MHIKIFFDIFEYIFQVNHFIQFVFNINMFVYIHIYIFVRFSLFLNNCALILNLLLLRLLTLDVIFDIHCQILSVLHQNGALFVLGAEAIDALVGNQT